MAWQVATNKKKGRANKLTPEAKAAAQVFLDALYSNSTFAAIAQAAVKPGIHQRAATGPHANQMEDIAKNMFAVHAGPTTGPIARAAAHAASPGQKTNWEHHPSEPTLKPILRIAYTPAAAAKGK